MRMSVCALCAQCVCVSVRASLCAYQCMCARARVCMRAVCMYKCVRARVCVCVCARAYESRVSGDSHVCPGVFLTSLTSDIKLKKLNAKY